MSSQIAGLNETPIDAELDLQEKTDSNAQLQSVDSRRDERCLAFYLLYAVDRTDYNASLDEVIADFQQEFDVTLPQDTFYKDLSRGAIERREQLDILFAPYLRNWRLERLGCCTLLILRLALWEIEQNKTPSTIIINEAIELAKNFAEKDAFKFINGVLDELVKHRETSQSRSTSEA